MARQQVSLGGFVFSQQGDFAYEGLDRKSSGGWQRIDILGAKPRAHNTGQDAETDLYPGLLAAVLSAAVRVSFTRWHVQRGAVPLPALLDEALDALSAGLPEPTN